MPRSGPGYTQDAARPRTSSPIRPGSTDRFSLVSRGLFLQQLIERVGLVTDRIGVGRKSVEEALTLVPKRGGLGNHAAQAVKHLPALRHRERRAVYEQTRTTRKLRHLSCWFENFAVSTV